MVPGVARSGYSRPVRGLGIDFGTSSTVAVLRHADGRVAPVLFGETPLLPSAVCAEDDGTLLAGRDALYLGRSRPERLELNPKRRIDEGAVLLGAREVPVTEVIAAVLRRAAAEATRIAGPGAWDTVVTCPAGWGPRRRAGLREAAMRAGLGAVTLCAEPVAAAAYFVHVLGHDIPAGQCLLVYDFGAGTFDASVVRRTRDGFAVLAEVGLTDAGGLDIDAAIVGYLGSVYAARSPDGWQRLTQPRDAGDLRTYRQLWQDVRDAKEMLSRTAMTTVHLPLLDEQAPLGREQLNRLALPVLGRTVDATRSAIEAAGVRRDEVAALFLVGGSSRIPLAATLLHRALGIAPTVIEQPELVVAGGSLYAPRDAILAADPTPAPIPPPPVPTSAPPPPVPSRLPSPPELTTPPPPAGPVSAMPVSPAAAPVSPAAGLFDQTGSGAIQPPPPAVSAVGPAPFAPAMGPTPVAPVVGAPVAPAVTSSPGAQLAKTPLVPPPVAPRAARSKVPLVAGTAVLAVVAVVVATVILIQRGDDNKVGQGAGTGCTNPQIAVLNQASNTPADLAKSVQQAAQLAVDQHNERHTDCPVKLVAVTGVDRIDSGVLGVVGPLLSRDVDDAGPRLDAAKLSFITPTATAERLSSKGWKGFHRAVPADGRTANVATKYLVGRGRSKIYTVTVRDDYGRAVYNATVKAGGGADVFGSKEIDAGDTNLGPVAATVAGAKPEGVIFAGYTQEGVALVKALRQAGYVGPIVAGDGVFDPGFAAGVGADGGDLGVLCGCGPPANGTAFAAAYKAKYGAEAAGYTGIAYDSANLLLQAIAGGAVTREQVTERLAAADYQGVMGRYKFTATGELTADSGAFNLFSVSGAGLQFLQTVR